MTNPILRIDVELALQNATAGLAALKKALADLNARAPGSAAPEASADAIGKAAKTTAQTASVAKASLDGLQQSATTWTEFLKARMGPAMRDFSSQGLSHADAHTAAIRQIAADWQKLKALRAPRLDTAIEPLGRAAATATVSVGALNRRLDELPRHSDAAGNSVGRLGSEVGKVVGFAALFEITTAAVRRLGSALLALPAAGFNFAKSTETAQIGMAGILGSMTQINGVAPTFTQGLGIASAQIRKLNDEALKTAASSQELITTFQALLGPGLAAGMSLDQIQQLTVVGVNAVKSMGLNANQVVQELRDLVAGGITPASSTLATALGLKDEDITKAKASAEGLFGFLMSRMRGFEQSSQVFGETLEGRLQAIGEAATRITADGMTPLIAAIKTGLADLNNALVKTEHQFDQFGNVIAGADKLTLNPDLVAGVRSLAEVFASLITHGGAVLRFLSDHKRAVEVLIGTYAAFKIAALGTGIVAASQARITAMLAEIDVSRAQAASRAAAAAADTAALPAVAGLTATYLAQLRAEVAATEVAVAFTAAKLAEARAAVAAATGMARLAAVEATLIPVQTAAATATAAHTAALGALAAAEGAATAGATGLRGAMAALGGIPGLIITGLTLAAGAFLMFGKEADKATESLDTYLARVREARQAEKDGQHAPRIDQARSELAQLEQRQRDIAGDPRAKVPVVGLGLQTEFIDNRDKIDSLKSNIAELEKLNNEQQAAAGRAGTNLALNAAISRNNAQRLLDEAGSGLDKALKEQREKGAELKRALDDSQQAQSIARSELLKQRATLDGLKAQRSPSGAPANPPAVQRQQQVVDSLQQQVDNPAMSAAQYSKALKFYADKVAEAREAARSKLAHKTPLPLGAESDAAKAAKQNLDLALQLLQVHLANETAEWERNYAKSLVSLRDYYAARQALSERSNAAEQQRNRDSIGTFTTEKTHVEALTPRTPAEAEARRKRLAEIDRELTTLNAANERLEAKRAEDVRAIAEQSERALKAARQSAAEAALDVGRAAGTDTPEQRRAVVEGRHKAALDFATANPDIASPEVIRQKIQLELDQGELDHLKQQIQQVFDSLDRQGKNLQLAGFEGPALEAALRPAREAAQSQLYGLLPQLDALAGKTISLDIKANVETAKHDIASLAPAVVNLDVVLRNSATNGFGQLFTDIATGANKAGAAFDKFTKGIVTSMLNVIGQKIGEKLFSSLLGGGLNLFGGLSGVFSGKASGGEIQARADGGLIRGPGTGTSDSITAAVPAGSYVIKARSVKAWGVRLLDHFAGGGRVPVRLSDQEYLFGPASAQRLGADLLERLNRGPGYAAGGAVLRYAHGPDYIPLPGFSGGGGIDALAPSPAGNRASGGSSSGAPSAIQVTLHPDALNLSLRDWLDGELARMAYTR